MSIRGYLAKAQKPEGHWVTIRGRHVFVRPARFHPNRMGYNGGDNPDVEGRHDDGSENRRRTAGGSVSEEGRDRPHGSRETHVGRKRARSGPSTLSGHESTRHVRRGIRRTLGRIWLAEASAPIQRTIETPSYRVHEVAGQAGARVFRAALIAAKSTQPYGAAVDVHDSAHYQQCRLFLTPHGEAGVAVEPNGNIVSVFKNSALADPAQRTTSRDMLLVAIQHGGGHLDCYDSRGFLPALYARVGFEPVARLKFSREFAPPGWDYARNGEPDIVFMRHNGDSLAAIRDTIQRGGILPLTCLKSRMLTITMKGCAGRFSANRITRAEAQRPRLFC